MTLTLQIHHHGQWHDAAELTFSDPESGRRAAVSLGYCSRYAIDWMARDDEHACSLNMPVELRVRYHE
ncbi:hypothetical protein [Kushneria aurantia]|uniref:TonB-dependent receptor n=1 Tax=Kushneria aurantia TaxID=504092 RepID=A0ABV6G323_9GAMM|nr:hypothetical protein [Kushneria aurantia]